MAEKFVFFSKRAALGPPTDDPKWLLNNTHLARPRRIRPRIMKILPRKLEISTLQVTARYRRLSGKVDIFGKVYSRKLHLKSVTTDRGIILQSKKKDKAIERIWVIAWQNRSGYSLCEYIQVANKVGLANPLRRRRVQVCATAEEARESIARFEKSLDSDDGWGPSSWQFSRDAMPQKEVEKARVN
ncbi:hypothetical protein [Roseibacillus ishigakijimensis]|uniref:Uncharacterized protein n=1 Tax=Roseibacillus ishigakijimensis TaxID=454146 RepID=A0A934VN56_9BACT|nr:hypothetical protein [Roseibacillus ishigakijimensis]MBK1834962.1 hypothetical protein [Roseibacillus ishigakijimensis]